VEPREIDKIMERRRQAVAGGAECAPHLKLFDSPRQNAIPNIKATLWVAFMFGGAEGNRTPVRKQLGKNFSGRSLLFTFPFPDGNKHPAGISSFMMHGTRKA